MSDNPHLTLVSNPATDAVADVTERLREASIHVLLDGIVILTHRIHPLSEGPVKTGLREQRDLIRAEVERRVAR